ncbi:macrophage mannose receptor 1-like [Scomber scombrus]|uniref:macrophage mannose receptor 1-like n=1 Tax=Scomber scombrus TaxID=13677 RepID=UPI002DDA413B|nr:macrophage mannose receptor 1-like [Scomber scombrus]
MGQLQLNKLDQYFSYPALQQYHLITHQLTWYEAQNYCRVKYTDLATVNNMDDENYLVRTLGSHVTYSWIGLQKGSTDRWMWSDGSGKAQFTKWAEGEPNNVGGNEGCTEMNEESEWVDIQCEDSKRFMCYERECQDGKERYVYYLNKYTWAKSQDICRNKHTDMATVMNEADNSAVSDLVQKRLPDSIWIGLFKDKWMWSDGRETSFRYWLPNSPYRGNCASVVVSQQGRWIENECTQTTPFVCQGDLKVKKMVIRLKVRSDVDPNDSTVTSALLKELEKSLRHESLTDFKLTWRNGKNGFILQRDEQLEVA